VQAALGLAGPAWVISTACSSGAKAYAAAARLIALGLIDAAVVGGADTLCMTTLYGFHSLELLSSDVCRPWDARRNGLSLGEGASFALLQRDDAAPAAWLLGCGESSDGHHMSSPHPEGAGAADAMRAALADASL
jgi:3-oxoacyl-[acyl-carrier-protein] synthase I